MEMRKAAVYGDCKKTANVGVKDSWMQTLCALRNINVGGTKAASLDLCVWFWFVVKHGESGSKDWWNSKGAGLTALCKLVLFFIYQYDEREFWFCRGVVAQQHCISSADWNEICNLEGSETGGQHSCREMRLKCKWSWHENVSVSSISRWGLHWWCIY